MTTDLTIGPDSAPDTLMRRALGTPFQDGAPGAGGSNIARRIANKIKQDRTRQATQTLLSNGQAEGSLRTARIMKEMHPEPTREVTQLPPRGDQIVVDPGTAKKMLKQRAGSSTAPNGIFGWADDYLFFLRKEDPDNAFLDAESELVALMASADVPQEIAFLATCGALTAINKLPLEEQLKRVRSGQDPKLRPVNNGSNITKVAFRLLAKDKSAVRLKKQLRPTQLGLGAKAGPETMVNCARANYAAGGLTLRICRTASTLSSTSP